MSYNKGYFLALAPLYAVFGYDARILSYGMPFFYAIDLATLFLLFRRARPGVSLLAFVLVAVMPVLADCLVRTKWHTIAYLPPLALLVFFLPEWDPGLGDLPRQAARWVGLGVFLLSCYLYFGCLLYGGPLALLLFLLWKRHPHRLPLAGGLGAAVAVAAFIVCGRINDIWSGRIGEEWGYLKTLVTREGLAERWRYIRDFYLHVLGGPYLVLYFTGLGVLLARARQGERFALIACVLYLPLWLFQLALEGPNNPDQLNWTMIGTLLVFLTGADTLVRLIRQRVPAGRWLVILLVGAVAWRELDRFPDYLRDYGNEFWTQIRDTKSQAALVLRLIQEDRTGQVRYFLPDRAVPEARGGFDYSLNLDRRDLAEGVARAHYFVDEADLRQKILAGPRRQWVVVYLSTVYPPADAGKDGPDPALGGLLGFRPEWINPYQEIYRNPFLVRKFKIRPEQLLPPGAAAAARSTS